MSEEEKKVRDDAAKADQAKADQAKADKAKADADDMYGKMMSRLDSISSRMDSWEEEKKKADKAKADADEDEKKKADKAKADETEEKKANEAANEPGAGDPKEVERKAADKAKADKAKADEDEKKEREDRARKDAEEEKKRMDAAARADSEQIAALQNKIAALEASTRPLTDDDYNALSAAQARADVVYQAWGQKAPRHMPGETSLAYRRRLATPLKQHSKVFKTIDLGRAFSDEEAFAAAEAHIYSDALDAAKSPVGVPGGQLREIRRADHGGREIVEFAGEPRAWMSEFMSTPHCVTRFDNSRGH